jgi:hypothetical protein
MEFADEDNMMPEKGFLDPSVYSKREFIIYIEKLLNRRGLIGKSYNFLAGPGIGISVTPVGDNEKRVVVSAITDILPTFTPVVFVEEYGKFFIPGAAEIITSVTVGTSRINSIITQGSDPNYNFTSDLIDLPTGASIQLEMSNSIFVDGNAASMGVTATATDIWGRSRVFTVPIQRKVREFWGTSQIVDVDYDVHDDSFQSSIDGIPNMCEIDHGIFPNHFVFLSGNELIIKASGLIVGLLHFEIQVNSYIQDLAYSRPYHLYISSGLSTGKFTYEIIKK